MKGLIHGRTFSFPAVTTPNSCSAARRGASNSCYRQDSGGPSCDPGWKGGRRDGRCGGEYWHEPARIVSTAAHGERDPSGGNAVISTISTVNQEYLRAKNGRLTFFNYTASKQFCYEIGLVWLGDDFVANADQDAWLAGFNQHQVDIAMRHHLWQVKYLFTPSTYSWYQRIFMALYFLTGWKPK